MRRFRRTTLFMQKHEQKIIYCLAVGGYCGLMFLLILSL